MRNWTSPLRYSKLTSREAALSTHLKRNYFVELYILFTVCIIAPWPGEMPPHILPSQWYQAPNLASGRKCLFSASLFLPLTIKTPLKSGAYSKHALGIVSHSPGCSKFGSKWQKMGFWLSATFWKENEWTQMTASLGVLLSAKGTAREVVAKRKDQMTDTSI